MPEGTVEIDTGGAPTSVNDDYADASETSDNQDTQETEDSSESQETETPQEDEVELTEKGTKKDPDPKSAVHQELANTKRALQQYQQVLNSPDLLKKYASQMGLTLAEAKEEIKEAKKTEEDLFKADAFKTPEDVANALNQLKSGFTEKSSAYEKQIEELKQQLSGLNSSQRTTQVANKLQNEVAAVRDKYPELNPKSSEYDKELETEIGALYTDLDYDQQSQSFRGNYSLAQLTDRVMKAAGKARKKGSEDAQTVVKQRQAGKVVTSSKKTNKGESESDNPSTAIAQRIKNMYG